VRGEKVDGDVSANEGVAAVIIEKTGGKRRVFSFFSPLGFSCFRLWKKFMEEFWN
jgi:hypothetical protein